MVVRCYRNTTSLTTVSKSNLSTVQTRETVKQPFTYDYMPVPHGLKKDMMFDLSPLLVRPFNYRYDTWNVSANRHSILFSHRLLENIFAANTGLSTALRSYAYFRAHACVYVSLTGTISHQGTLLVGVLPGYDASYAAGAGSKSHLINTILSSPHALLGANEATSACIEIPFYVPTDFLTMDASTSITTATEDLALPGLNVYATLVGLVLNPLAASENTSTTVSLNFQFEIQKLEVYVPVHPDPGFVNPPALESQAFVGPVITSLLDTTSSVAKAVTSDFIDGLRGAIRGATGLHNPNRPALRGAHLMQTRNRMNVVDDETQYEKMDPFTKFSRVTKDGIFHTSVDEMNLSYILSKPQYIGSFSVANTTGEGTLLKCGPICPMQFNAFGNFGLTSNIERLYYNTYAWSGDMELIVQSTMTNKHSLKMVVARCYGLDRRIASQVPSYVTTKISPSSLLEFSAGNQQQVVQLDFLSRNQVLQNTMDPVAAAFQHGMYYIYLVQPLTLADGVPNQVEFNLFLRCKENFRFHGHSNRDGRTYAVPTKYVPSQITEEESMELEGQSAPSCDPVMNAPNTCCPMAEAPEEQPPELIVDRIKPIENMREIIRRPVLAYYNIFNPGTSGVFNINIPIAALLGYAPQAQTQTVNHSVFRMFYGYNGGVKLKIKLDVANAVVRYCPPTYVYTNYGNNGMQLTHYLLPSSILQNSSDDGYVDSRLSVEAPHYTSADISSGKSYSVYDVHIPQHSILNFVGGLDYLLTTPTYEWNTKIAAFGYITISGRIVAADGTRVRTWIFAGADDEGRLGFHTMAPFMGYPITGSTSTNLYSYEGSTSATALRPLSLITPKSISYTNLVTPYETAPT